MLVVLLFYFLFCFRGSQTILDQIKIWPQKEENGLLLRGKDEMLAESGSGSEQMEDKSGNEQENSSDQLLLQQQQQQGKKKRYHRHTARQIQEMES